MFVRVEGFYTYFRLGSVTDHLSVNHVRTLLNSMYPCRIFNPAINRYTRLPHHCYPFIYRVLQVGFRLNMSSDAVFQGCRPQPAVIRSKRFIGTNAERSVNGGFSVIINRQISRCSGRLVGRKSDCLVLFRMVKLFPVFPTKENPVEHSGHQAE